MNILIKHYINKLKKEILKQNNVKEYLFFKSKLNDNDLKTLQNQVKIAKKDLVKSTVLNKDSGESLSKYNELNNQYNENPIIENYLYLKDDVYNDLYQIKELIDL